MEEDQLQPALTRPQSQLRLVGLLQLRIAQTPQLHLNTHRSPACQLDVAFGSGIKSDFAESDQPETPGSAHPLKHSGFLRAQHSPSAAGVSGGVWEQMKQ